MANMSMVKKTVSFVYVKDSEWNYVPNGTGFFVGIKLGKDEDSYMLYFVTAKHVIQDCNGNYLPDIWIRINKKEWDSVPYPINLKDIRIFEHTDNCVDVAVFNLVPDKDIFDYKFIPDEMITNNDFIKNQEIEEGDDVFFTGLFTSHIGQKRNQPIVRFGKIALM